MAYKTPFILPSKTSRALKITTLSPKQNTSSASPRREKASAVQKESHIRGASDTSDDGGADITTPVQSPTADQQSQKNGSNAPDQEDSRPSKAGAFHVIPNQLLDIYAISYIPLWLRAVNESFALIRQSTPLNTIDYATYLTSYSGYSILSPIPQAHDLPVTEVPLRVPLGTAVSTENYSWYWLDRQQNELAEQAVVLQSYNLYNYPIHLQDAERRLFQCEVPGMRENAPLIELGDTVLVRPLIPVIPSLAAKEIVKWYQNRDQSPAILAPAFSGFEYRAVVWGLSRAQEYVLLRIDALQSQICQCNVMFIVQEHKFAPLYQSIEYTANLLTENHVWMDSMLFPRNEHGSIQETLSRGFFEIEWLDSALNFEQRKAVATVVKCEYGDVPYLVSGPPGTGKTKTIVEMTLQLLERKNCSITPHILVCAASNSAADTLALRLSTHLSPKELFRLNGYSRSFAEVPDYLMQYCYVYNDLFTIPAFSAMMSFKVVVTTCQDANALIQARMTNEALSWVVFEAIRLVTPSHLAPQSNLIHWTALLLDEAAQATEPEVLIPLSVVCPPPNNVGGKPPLRPQVVMAGDEYQLGPRIASKKGMNEIRVSLFQRLFERPFYAGHPLSRENGLKPLKATMLPMVRPAFTNLMRNYRSHPAILAVPSLLFYHDTLIPERRTLSQGLKDWIGWRDPHRWPVIFKQNNTPDDVESPLSGNGSGAGTIFNIGEAEIALQCVHDLLRHTCKFEGGRNQKDVIVMSPFKAQVNVLRKKFRKSGLGGVNIGPLEAFQGLEARFVVICTTRTRLGAPDKRDRFVRDDQSRSLGVIGEPKRFNVAITRAMEGLIVIGDVACLTCTGDRCWIEFVRFCSRNGCLAPGADGKIPEVEVEGYPANIGRLEKALTYRVPESASNEPGYQHRLFGNLDPLEEMLNAKMTLPDFEEIDDLHELSQRSNGIAGEF